MTITPQNLIALLPLLIVGLTVVVVMLSIAWRRNHFLNATLSVIGLNAALVSLWFVGQAGAMDVTPLMRVDGFAMLYTGLYCWRASPPVLSPTRGLKAITTTRTSSTCWC